MPSVVEGTFVCFFSDRVGKVSLHPFFDLDFIRDWTQSRCSSRHLIVLWETIEANSLVDQITVTNVYNESFPMKLCSFVVGYPMSDGVSVQSVVSAKTPPGSQDNVVCGHCRRPFDLRHGLRKKMCETDEFKGLGRGQFRLPKQGSLGWLGVVVVGDFGKIFLQVPIAFVRVKESEFVGGHDDDKS